MYFLIKGFLPDGSVSVNTKFNQMDKNKLELVMKLCDQLGYKHIPYPPELRSNGIFEFRLYSNGTRKFYDDIQGLYTKDPLLGLWHKHV